MKKIALVALLSVALLLSYGVSVGFAQDAAEEAPAAAESAEPIGAKLTGTNYNLLKTYAKDEAAEANPSLALLNALKVTAAEDIDGNPLEGLVGKTVYYVPNAKAQGLLVAESMQDKEVVVIGMLHMAQRAIVVEMIEGASGDEWDELGVGNMSQMPVL